MGPTLKTSVGSTRKAEETRARILSEALTLFRERGFDQTTMRDIARAAGVAIGAAYYYFESKEALVMAFYGEASKSMHEQIETALGRKTDRSEEHTSELQSHLNLVCRLLLEKKKKNTNNIKI